MLWHTCPTNKNLWKSLFPMGERPRCACPRKLAKTCGHYTTALGSIASRKPSGASAATLCELGMTQGARPFSLTDPPGGGPRNFEGGHTSDHGICNEPTGAHTLYHLVLTMPMQTKRLSSSALPADQHNLAAKLFASIGIALLRHGLASCKMRCFCSLKLDQQKPGKPAHMTCRW